MHSFDAEPFAEALSNLEDADVELRLAALDVLARAWPESTNDQREAAWQAALQLLAQEEHPHFQIRLDRPLWWILFHPDLKDLLRL